MGLQLTSLTLLGVFSSNNPPTADVKNFMQQFVKNCLGNNQLNSFLNQAVVRNQLDHYGYTTVDSIDKIAYFSFKTRNLKNKEQALAKLTSVHEAIINDQPIKNKDKLSLKELGLAADLAKTNSFLKKLNDAGFIADNKLLEQMYKNSLLAKEIVEHIEEKNNEKFKEAGSSIVIFDDVYKKSNVLDNVIKFANRITTLFSKHEHASMLHFKQEAEYKTIQRSHINPQLSKDNFDIDKQLYADSYRIELTALISTQNQQLLASMYGKDWQNAITVKFQSIQSEIHNQSQDKFGQLSASSSINQALSGLANLVPFGHKKLAANDFEELHRKVMSEEFAKQKDNKMLCSEFCATTIAITIVELNKQIKEDMKSNKAMKVMGIDLEKENIVNIPFSKHEDLHKMHPDRLLSVLKSYKCVEPVVTEDQKYLKHQTKSAARKIISKIKKHLISKTAPKHSTKSAAGKQNLLTR